MSKKTCLLYTKDCLYTLSSLNIALKLLEEYEVLFVFDTSIEDYQINREIFNSCLGDEYEFKVCEVDLSKPVDIPPCLLLLLEEGDEGFIKPCYQVIYGQKEDKFTKDKYLSTQEFFSSSGLKKGQNFALNLSGLDFIAHNRYYYASEISQLVSARRYAHVVSVAHLCYVIADKNLSKIKAHNPCIRAYEAGFLHDVARSGEKFHSYYKKVEQEEKQYFFNEEIPSYAYHQFVAPLYLKEVMDIHDEEVLDAIEYHTTGNKSMTWLSKILYASDKIDPQRDYDSSDLIQAMEADFKKGFITVLKANRDFLYQGGKNDPQKENSLTKACYEHYLKGEDK